MAEENPAAQRQTAVTAVTVVCLCTVVSMLVIDYEKENPETQRQTAVTAYFSSKRLLLSRHCSHFGYSA